MSRQSLTGTTSTSTAWFGRLTLLFGCGRLVWPALLQRPDLQRYHAEDHDLLGGRRMPRREPRL